MLNRYIYTWMVNSDLSTTDNAIIYPFYILNV
jgi:hypothetical protein